MLNFDSHNVRQSIRPGGPLYFRLLQTPYLHARRVPLAQAVALDEAHLGDDGQTDGFGNECEGHCGV